MKVPRAVVFAFAALFASVLHAQSAGSMHKNLAAEAERLQTWSSDKVLIDAVKAQNARKVPLAEIQKIDKEWTGGKVRKEIMSGPCADRLRELSRQQNYYVEIFVSDNQGALVCANEPTTDYWQGDEPKWERAFLEGKGGLFIDRPKYDESAKATLATINLPIFEGKMAIGVITVGVVADKLPAAK
jgi:hypothetical protein